MDFESLAFSGSARSLATEASVAYCSACQEECVPELTCSRAERALTCPTCGGPTTSGSAPELENELVTRSMAREVASEPSETTADSTTASVAAGASTPMSSSNTPTIAPPPRAAATVGPQLVQDRRSAVRDRVAQEVLTFIAAIERGELPTAVGLPVPPGANFLDSLRGQGSLVGERNSAPASPEALKKLHRFKVEENSWVLHQTTLRLGGPSGLSVDALFAPFSSPPADTLRGPLVMADPATAHDALQNEASIRGSILIVDRGVCTFASKGLRAEVAGALAVVVVQTLDAWPYVMEDSKGEAKKGDGLGIPMCMVNKENGKLIKDALKAAKGQGSVRAELSVSSSERDCIVCQELFTVGADVVRLPCHHMYHEACVLKWLKMSNTCPYCRRELPTCNKDTERERRRRQEAASGDEAWRLFFD